MFCLACTGGIGSGKSYIVKLFSAMGISSYIADERAKLLYSSNRELAMSLIDLLGEDIFVDGILQKHVMASKIFSNSQLLAKVNDIVHPKVLEDFFRWREDKQMSGEKLVIFESAIFLETPIFHQIADRVLVVVAPEDVRICRVMKRDCINESLVKERISKQWTDQQRCKSADFIIFADGKLAVLPQVLKVIENINKIIS